ncbi:hypothetical protein ACFXHA_33805 [Nocardia sp. NPDC059240]|uniref:hypothetical protein n=1 Tax=Nocardia sp. NPDC059240 TaxID=3346786 RepID=UPI0036AC5616
MNRAGGRRHRCRNLVWSLLGAALLVLIPVADCALVGAGTHGQPIAMMRAAVTPVPSADLPPIESAHCAPQLVDVIRSSGCAEPTDRVVPATTDGTAADLRVSALAVAPCGVRGPPPQFAGGGRELLTRLCIARR